MQALFSIDGTAFAVGVESLNREAKVTDGDNTGTALSGARKRDLRGVYYNYSMQISADALTQAEYDALYEILSSAQESHSITVPYGQGSITFDAAVDSVSDELIMVNGASNVWGNLSISFTAMRPYRTP